LPDNTGKYYFKKDTSYNIFVYIFGSFDIFRLERPVGNIFFSDYEQENDNFRLSEKYSASKEILKLDVLKTSLSEVPYIKDLYSIQ
jgi:hypothetical protein